VPGLSLLGASGRRSRKTRPAAGERIHDQDLAEGWGRVLMPDALDRKYPGSPTDWRWQWVFPQAHRWRNAQTGRQGRVTSMRRSSFPPARTLCRPDRPRGMLGGSIY
jgi:hypothetical protein